MTRAFVALCLDEATRAVVAAEIERLRPLSRAVAWVPAANLHLTLKFLGEQPDPRLGEAAEALEDVAGATAPFALALCGLGAFPGVERPRILWVGVADGAPDVRDLQGRVETALEQRGFARDSRPWHAHLTIGRVFDAPRWRREAGPALRDAIAAGAHRTFGRLAVSRLVLMRSDLTPRGARYSELRSVQLVSNPGR